MNKRMLVEAVAERMGGDLYDDPKARPIFIREATDAVEQVLSAIVAEVSRGGTVSITGFGSFAPVTSPARYARNPQTGDRVRVKETLRIRFTPGQNFKDLVARRKRLPHGTDSVIRKAPKGSITKAG